MEGKKGLDLLQVRNGMYIAKNDLFSMEKYLRYYPNDTDARYHYARALEATGKKEAAYQQFALAAQAGHYASLGKLKKDAMKKSALTDATTATSATAAAGTIPWFFRTLLYATLIAAILFLLLSLFRFFIDTYITKHTIIEYQQTSVIHRSVEQENAAAPPTSSTQTTARDLPLLVVENGLDRYKETTGHYPAQLTDLTGKQPQNYISQIPPGLSYAPGLNDGYTLVADNTLTAASTADTRLELHYYPATNQLGLIRGQEVLALYPVASGSPLPFQTSKVTTRVVNPNGGTGALGTRGLALEDHYAIHGTNTPALIGKSGVTHGCLRMNNADIERLYPYIATGTVFRVVPGHPARPTFANGLPSLDGSEDTANLQREENPGMTYSWNG